MALLKLLSRMKEAAMLWATTQKGSMWQEIASEDLRLSSTANGQLNPANNNISEP